MWVSRYFVIFVVISFIGWVYETFYALIRRHRWEDRGFLHGPVCPIYGVGALLLVAICQMWEWVGLGEPTWWEIFLVSCLGSMGLEYVTSWGLERLFHARWWDYSNVPLNINGRVCLPAALAFGVAGWLLTYLILPFVEGALDMLSPTWVDLLAIILAVMLVMDLINTVAGLTNFGKKLLVLSNWVNGQVESRKFWKKK